MLQNLGFKRRKPTLARIEASPHLLRHSRTSLSPSPGNDTENSLSTECYRFFSWCTRTVTTSGSAAAKPNWKWCPSSASGAMNSLFAAILPVVTSRASWVVWCAGMRWSSWWRVRESWYLWVLLAFSE